MRVALRDGRRLLVSTTASRTVRGYIDLGPEGSELGLVGLDARPVDFNGDGRTDLFGILEGRPRVGYWRSWSTSGFDVVEDSVTVLPAGAQLIDLADVNADGLTDLLVEQPYSDLTRVGPTIEQCANERHVVLYVASTAKPDTRLFEAPRHLMCLDDQATPYHREFEPRDGLRWHWEVRAGIRAELTHQISIQGEVIENGNLRTFRNAEDLETVSSNGLSYIVLCVIFIGFINRIRRGAAINVTWALDEIKDLDIGNVEVLMSVLRRNNITLVSACPDLDVDVLAMFRNRRSIRSDRVIYDPSGALAHRLTAPVGDEVLSDV